MIGERREEPDALGTIRRSGLADLVEDAAAAALGDLDPSIASEKIERRAKSRPTHLQAIAKGKFTRQKFVPYPPRDVPPDDLGDLRDEGRTFGNLVHGITCESA